MAEERTGAVSKIRVLGHSDLIGDLSAESLDYLGDIGECIQLDRNAVLFLQDDPGDAIYVVQSGSVEISILSPSGKKLSLNVMQPPDVFGEIAALDGRIDPEAIRRETPARMPRIEQLSDQTFEQFVALLGKTRRRPAHPHGR